MQRHRLSIKLKLLLAILPILAALGFLTTIFVSSYIQHSFQLDLEKQQLTLVSLMAQKLDDQFASYQKTIVSFSKSIPRQALNNSQLLEQYLDSRQGILEIFDNNVVVFSPRGVLVAETAKRPSRTGTDFSFREYIIQTRKNWLPTISKPFQSQLSHRPPVVMFTAPVLDKDGTPLAIVGGSINLLRPNLLGRLATTRIGTNGYFYLSDLDRTMIMHPDENRLMKPVAAPGVNRLYDRALAGFEGAGETSNSEGVAMLTAFKRLSTVNWIMAAQIPVKEAFAAVNTARRLAWISTGSALLVLAILTIAAASHLLAPLQMLTTRVSQVDQDSEYQPIKIASNDEISELATAFNSLMYQLQARERDLRSSRELFQFLADFSHDWIFWRIPDGAMLYISPAAEEITGYSVDELMADPSLTYTMIHPEDRDLWDNHLCQIEKSPDNESIDFRIITKTGQVRWLRHSCVSILDDNGILLGIRGSNRDITERKLALLTLKENEERFRLIAKTAHDAIIMTDLHHRISFWNPAAELLFGADSSTVLGVPLVTFLPGLVDAVHQAETSTERGLMLEISGRHQDGHQMMVELAYSQARLSGAPVTVVVARDITARKQTEEQLRYISLHDSLTGLYNRAAFEHHLSRFDQEGPFPLAVIMADLDGLKQVNDTQGHEAGDRLLKAAAELLSLSFRTNDIVARIGGDEFALLLPGIPEEMARNKFNRLQRQIELFTELPENPQVALSCGMIHVTGPGQLLEAVKQADQLMYQQKKVRKQNSFPL
ncbi:PAS domain S-box protein [Trichlorobacter lovleyi]|uniref:PAS domain S-box protein n=1 Tax=Trichlorobacter lovleyi TaxID=313985 RepID=UPI00223FD7E6|nr:PAS domain S-box protein [Trichlorobacter lovleyi]QOX78955.1 PAS domain S-box protein [Trichlorobacter lovleyi]